MKFASVLVTTALAAPYETPCESTHVAPVYQPTQGAAYGAHPTPSHYSGPTYSNPYQPNRDSTSVAPVYQNPYATKTQANGYNSGHRTKVDPVVQAYDRVWTAIQGAYNKETPTQGSYGEVLPATQGAYDNVLPVTQGGYQQVSPATPAYGPTTCSATTTAYDLPAAPTGGAYAEAAPAKPYVPIESANPVPSAAPVVEQVLPVEPSGQYSAPAPTGDLPASPSSPYNDGGLYATQPVYEDILPSSASRLGAFGLLFVGLLL